MAIAELCTLDTTWAVLLCDPRNPDAEDGWHFPSSAQYVTPADIHEWLVLAYDGWFADPAHHRIVRIDRTIVQEGEEGYAPEVAA